MPTQTPAEARAAAQQVIDHARDLYDAFASALSDDQRDAQGTFTPYTSWSAKDVIGHFTYWNVNTAIRVEEALNDRPISNFEDEDALNAQAYVARYPLKWAQVWDEANATLDRMAKAVADAKDDAIAREYDGRTIGLHVYGNAIAHAGLHIADYWLANGDRSRAEGLHQQIVKISGETNGPRGKATATYNLACLYARLGENEKALSLLPDVFAAVPDLRDWATQDADLVSLHGLPAFQEMVRQPA